MHAFGRCLLLSALTWPLAMLAGPASPDPITVKQPNGKIFQARLRGDEFQAWMETLDGYTILQNPQSGMWEYGQLEPHTGRLVPCGLAVEPHQELPPTFQRHLRPQGALEKRREREAIQAEGPTHGFGAAASSERAPVSGNKRLLVILVSFADRPLTTTAASWNATLFQTGTGAKSMRQFYKDNSMGLVDVLPVAHAQAGNPAGIVTVSLTTAHPNYGKDYTYTAEKTWLNLALAQAATHVNFASLDTNGDGTIAVDEAAIYFIPAGYENSGSSKTPNLWAHAWGGGGVTAGGKAIPKWAMNGELNNSDRQHPMGVVAHELGHSLMGLPDLYDTASTNQGLGAFSLMANGSWGRDSGEDSGTTPVALDAWCREVLGWTVPQVPTTNGQLLTLPSCLSAPDAAVKIQNAVLSTQEFFYAEYRRPEGWDRGLIRYMGSSWQGGLLITHVDNRIGTNKFVAGSHQRVMAEHANNAPYGSMGEAGSLFSATTNPLFVPGSTPSSAFYDGANSCIGVVDISAPGPSMTFRFSKLSDSTPPTGSPTTPTATVALDAATLAWTLGGAADAETGIAGYRLQVGTTPGGSDVFNDFVGRTLSHTLADLGLRDGTPLYARVTAVNGLGLEGAYSPSSTPFTVNLPTFEGTVLDNPQLTFKTVGPWTVDTFDASLGGSSARSAAIGHDKRTYLQTRLTGPGTLTFDWKVSSEKDYDYLYDSLDGTIQPGKISGTSMPGFATVVREIPAGSHTVRWTYEKDEATVTGTDAAWVDNVRWTGATAATATITPAAWTTIPGATQPFTATLSQPGSTATWSATGGTFASSTTASGVANLFTAGPALGTFVLTATPSVSPNQPGSATVTLVDPTSVTVGLTSSASTVTPGTPLTLTPSVSVLSDKTVRWSTDGGSFLTQSGTAATWSAPTQGTYTLTATSTVAQTRTASVTVTVKTVAPMALSPASKVLLPGASQVFTVSDELGGGVTWTLSGATGATKVEAGLSCTVTLPAEAPTVDRTFVLTATSVKDASRSATATLTLRSMDLNKDGAVDLVDLLSLARHWGTSDPAADLDGNGTVGAEDLTALLAKL